MKFKLERQQEFVVGGYRPGGSAGIDALLVGYYEGSKSAFCGEDPGRICSACAARVARSARAPASRKMSFRQSARRASLALGCRRYRGADGGNAGGVRPKIVVQIRFVQWTAEGRLRHPAYMGLRDDKAARDMQREP